MPKISDEMERAIAARIIEDPSPNLTKIGEEFGVGRVVVARVRLLPRVALAVRRKPTLRELRARIARTASLANGKVFRDGKVRDLKPRLNLGVVVRMKAEERRSKTARLDQNHTWAKKQKQPMAPGDCLVDALRWACMAYLVPPCPTGHKAYHRYRRARMAWEEWRDANPLPEPVGGLRTAVPAEASTPTVLGILG